MKKLIPFLVLPLFAGCFTATMPIPDIWPLEFEKSAFAPIDAKAKPKYPVTRLTFVTVAPPYDRTAMTISREKGTVAFDAYNQFAALPSILLRAPSTRMLGMSGLFEQIVYSTSSGLATHSIEVGVPLWRLKVVTKENGEKGLAAEVRVAMDIQNEHRVLLTCGVGSALVPVEDGNYGKAFSRAYAQAFRAALKDL